jgi:hypothetical protein
MTERNNDHDDDAPADGRVSKRSIPSQAPIRRTKVKATDDFYTLVGRLAREVKAEGIRPPVLACFWADTQPARQAYRAMYQLRLENDVIETWTLQHAIMMLRGRAGLAGMGIANLLAAHGNEASEWLLEFQQRYLSVNAYTKDDNYEILLLHRKIRNVVCFDCRRNAAGRGARHCHLPNGEQTIICGRNAQEANEIVRLCWVAATRCLPCVATDEAPEVIRALRKVPGAVDSWMSDVLYGRQQLSGLAQAVTQERHGGGGEQRNNDAASRGTWM